MAKHVNHGTTNTPTTINDVRFMILVSYNLRGEIVIIPAHPTLISTSVARLFIDIPIDNAPNIICLRYVKMDHLGTIIAFSLPM